MLDEYLNLQHSCRLIIKLYIIHHITTINTLFCVDKYDKTWICNFHFMRILKGEFQTRGPSFYAIDIKQPGGGAQFALLGFFGTCVRLLLSCIFGFGFNPRHRSSGLIHSDHEERDFTCSSYRGYG